MDVASTSIEKGLDLIKDFLSKLIGPSIEEVGLILVSCHSSSDG